MIKKKIFFILLVLTILIVGIYFYTNKNIFKKPIDTSGYNNTYSNGWYGYTVRFPSNYYVLYGHGGIPGSLGPAVSIDTSSIDFRDQPMGNGFPCKISVVQVADKHPNETPIQDINLPAIEQINFNGIKWYKLKFTSLPNSMLYRYDGVKWQTEKDGLIYFFQSDQDNERDCQSIVSTFKFGIDKNDKTAVEAEKIKNLAISYTKNRYKDKIFWEGGFLYNSREQKDLIGLLDSTNKSMVVFVDPKNNKYPNNLGIILSNLNGDWQIETTTNEPY